MTSAAGGPIEGRPLKVLFCGLEFPDGARCTAAALADCPDIQVDTCSREEVPSQIVDADMAIPLMTRLDAATIAKGARLRLVLQFGVGLEGVDMQACSERGGAVYELSNSAYPID
jgi:phosphoglycerate dehydrogenase-like enzyme